MRRIVRAMVWKLRTLWQLIFIIPPARLIGALRNTRQIISVWPDAPVLGPRLVLFMHYDAAGAVRPQILAYISELAASGRAIVFVTNSGKLNPIATQSLRKLCASIVIRRNVGYDFGAWRDTLDHLGLPRAETEEIIFANDSVFGPLHPLNTILDKFDYSVADIWGLTESWQTRYHLQSFFMAFGPKALHAEAFKKFWRSVRPVPAKTYIIKIYEIGVTQTMLKGGLHCAALWPYETLVNQVTQEEFDRVTLADESEASRADPILMTRRLQILRIRDAVARRIALNPTADLWRQLLISGFPFIKRELLRYNPSHVQDVGDWVAVVRETVGSDPAPILRDLRLMLKDSAP